MKAGENKTDGRFCYLSSVLCHPLSVLCLLSFVFCLIPVFDLTALELSGYAAVEGRVFFNEPVYGEQTRDNVSIAVQPEIYHDIKNFSFTFVPFLRLDSADSDRSHYDIREFDMLWFTEQWELRIGVSKVFWGVTESQHLVDIINQTDIVESIDAEEKLGQPMLNLTLPLDWGTIDLFVLPYFRERTFAGHEGRFRLEPVIETDRAIYESGSKEYHIDLAVRYSHTAGNWDIGLSHFYGTSREPAMLQEANDRGEPILIPFYEQIGQTGIDVQLVQNEWLWKLESIYRRGQGDRNFFGFTGGFEYTFNSVTTGGMNIGALAEWLYDDRGRNAATPFNNDIMTGLRVELNDAAGTEALIGIIQDYKNPARVITLEGSRRLSDHWKVSVEGYFFLSQPSDDLFYSLRNDDYFMVELAYYF